MPSTNHHILVVATAAVAPSGLGGAVASLAGGSRARIQVVAPALNSRLRHWMSDSDAAHAAAESRLAGYLDRLARPAPALDGHAGDADPLHAIDDALATFPATALVCATEPDAHANRLPRRLPGRARDRFGLPLADVQATPPRRPVPVAAARTHSHPIPRWISGSAARLRRNRWIAQGGRA